MKKVLIIGAGPAGLTAAYELLKTGEYDVTVLERSQDIGGISKTVRYRDNRMDIGGHRFFSKDERVMQWWADMMPLQGAPAMDDRLLNREVPLAEGGPDPEKEDRVMLTRNRVSRIYYQHHFFDYPISLKWETLKTMGFATTMQVGFSYLAACIHKRPNDNLENFYINSFGKKLYSMFFEGYTEKLWGRHPREIDASWGKQCTKELSSGTCSPRCSCPRSAASSRCRPPSSRSSAIPNTARGSSGRPPRRRSKSWAAGFLRAARFWGRGRRTERWSVCASGTVRASGTWRATFSSAPCPSRIWLQA